MTHVDALGKRLALPDSVQLLTLYLAVLLIALLLGWSGDPTRANDAWFPVAQSRAVALALLGLGHGASLVRAPRSEQVLAAALVTVFALVGLPVELAAYAASHPAVPPYWLLLAPIDGLSAFALGLALGHALAVVRLNALLPLAVPAMLVGLVAADVWLGLPLLSPVAYAIKPGLPHLLLSTALALGLGGYLLRPHRETSR